MLIVAITDDDVFLLSTISRITKEGEFGGAKLDDAMVITQASNLSNYLILLLLIYCSLIIS